MDELEEYLKAQYALKQATAAQSASQLLGPTPAYRIPSQNNSRRMPGAENRDAQFDAVAAVLGPTAAYHYNAAMLKGQRKERREEDLDAAPLSDDKVLATLQMKKQNERSARRVLDKPNHTFNAGQHAALRPTVALYMASRK